MELNKIYKSDALQSWPCDDKYLDTIVTSPPYWGLRDYGVAGQLGMEKTPEEFIDNMVMVFRHARRCLKDNGTLWVNIGDSYASVGKWGGSSGGKHAKDLHGQTGIGRARREYGDLKPKDLVGIPWMLAFALRADGWYLRQDIIWHKPNPMPESATDRCTKSHEYLFLFSKSKQYYFDAFSIATPYADKTYTTFGIPSTPNNKDGTGMVQSENWAKDIAVRQPKKWKMPDGWDTGEGSHGSFHREGREKGKKRTIREEAAAKNEINGRGLIGHSGNLDAGGNLIGNGLANKRSVWTVPTAPFKQAHFATFPPSLIVDCIKAGCPPGGVVGEPFCGAGTTPLVARKLDRNFWAMEIKQEYISLSEKRLSENLGLFI